jgi:hypothetical protein
MSFGRTIKKFRISASTASPALFADGGAIQYGDPHNDLNLPNELKDVLRQIEALYHRYVRFQMFENYDTEQPLVVAKQPDVPPEAKREMRNLLDTAALLLRSIAPAEIEIETQVPPQFR